MKCPKIWIKRQHVPTYTTVDHSDIERHRKRSASETAGWISCPHWVWFDSLAGNLAGFSAVLGSAEITEKRRSSWDAELFICKIQIVCKSETLSTWVAEPIIYARNSAPDKWCTLFSHQTGQLSVSSLATMSSAALPPPPPETMGWRLEDSVFVSVLKSLHSCPDACADLIFHACIHNVQELVANAECLVYHAQ